MRWLGSIHELWPLAEQNRLAICRTRRPVRSYETVIEVDEMREGFVNQRQMLPRSTASAALLVARVVFANPLRCFRFLDHCWYDSTNQPERQIKNPANCDFFVRICP